MAAIASDDTNLYKVVINHEEQYSLWPADQQAPKGWRDAGRQGTRRQMLDYIEEVWTDMRPLALTFHLAFQEMERQGWRTKSAG